ncbi:MAG: hypothetical protein KGJ08_08775 [Gammaproteobacteria bacterium]|nr:hypothetical protein [Gammaproteobacteria bacterium]
MSKKLKFVLACMIAVLPLAANALGLGEIKLNSALNQPLDAEIPIVGAAADEINSLHIKVASADQFKQAGIPMADVLIKLKFKIVQGPNGTASIHITTSEAMREPFLDFLADATWDNGELIREYTVFLNPPNFETATQEAPAAASAATQPAASAPVGTTTAPAPAATPTPAPVPAPPPAAAPVPVAPKPAPQPVATTATVTPAVSAVSKPLGGNYGPIHRGETLSEIALNMRPQGVTLNQMMIAIYRANPEVFMRNINLMKAGYVLRVPTLEDIQAVRVAEANTEVRTQIASWRASRGLGGGRKTTGNAEQPSLQLVAPSSAAQTTENQIPGAGESKTGEAMEANAAGTASKAQSTGAGAASTTSNAPIAVASNSMSAVQVQASKQNKQAAETKTTPLSPEKPAVVKPLPKNKITPTESTSGGLMDSLLNPYVIITIIVIVLVLIAGIYIKKRRASAELVSKPIKIRKTPAAEADWGKEEKAGLKDVTDLKSSEGSDDAAGSPVGEAGMGTTASRMSTTNLKLDESDPMAEADFHMAYGLYDQAADVLNKALGQDPNRRELKMKLLEVYFTAGDRSNFVETARGLRQEIGASPDNDWENIAIMGRQVAPEEPLFSGDSAATGAAGAHVDIPLDSGGTGTAVHTDLDPLAGAFEGMRPVTMPAAATKPAAHEQQVVDFSLPDIEPVPRSKKSTPAAAGAAVESASVEQKPTPVPEKKTGESTVTADFGTDSQVEFDKALKELSDFVNTNVPPQEEMTRSGRGQPMSLVVDAEMPGEQTGISTGTGTGTGEETTGLNEIGTKLDLARAYIDMGDADGAKHILEEVLEEGDSQQQQDAKKLLQSLN